MVEKVTIEKEKNTRYNWKFYQGRTHTRKKIAREKVPGENAEEPSSNAGYHHFVNLQSWESRPTSLNLPSLLKTHSDVKENQK